MTYYDRDELIDLIRHTFRTEDDTGMCDLVVDKPRRKQQPGGLPLNFGRNKHDNDDDESSSSVDSYKIPPDEEGKVDRSCTMERSELFKKKAKQGDTRSIVWKMPTDRRRRKTTDDDDACCSTTTIIDNASSPFEYYTDERRRVMRDHRSSMLTQMLNDLPSSSSAVVGKNPFMRFAQFEAMDNGRIAYKSFLILCPLSNTDASSPSCIRFRIYTRSSAKVSDVIGLCCYIYTINAFQPPLIPDDSRYDLYFSDESGEIETDFPPLNRDEIIDRFGFTVLVLMERTIDGNGDDEDKMKEIAIVYMTNGNVFRIEIESNSITLQTIRDRALEQHRQQLNIQLDQHRLEIVDDYELELADRSERDHRLLLSTTISQYHHRPLEFIMIRKISSRGDFQTPTQQQQRTVMENGMISTLSDTQQQRSPHSLPSTVMSSNHRRAISVTSLHNHIEYQPSTDDDDDAFLVYRIHKFKSKWQAKLTFRIDMLQIEPCKWTSSTMKRNTLIPQMSPNHKSSLIAWDRIGGVEVADDHRLVDRKIMRIIWQQPSSAGGEHWKILQIDADIDTAYRLCTRITDIIDKRQSSVRQLYMQSISEHHHIENNRRKSSSTIIAAASSFVFSHRRRLPIANSLTPPNNIPTLSRFVSKP